MQNETNLDEEQTIDMQENIINSKLNKLDTIVNSMMLN